MEHDEEHQAAQARRDAWWSSKVVRLADYRAEKERLRRELERLQAAPPWVPAGDRSPRENGGAPRTP